MNIKPVLGEWEIPRITSIESVEERAFVELQIPGRVGSLFHDMNTAPTRIAISGSLYGDEARNTFLDKVRKKFQDGQAVTFVADILSASKVDYVIIESLELEQVSAQPDELRYRFCLRESPPPPPPPSPLGSLDSDLLDQASGLIDSVGGALDLVQGLGSIPDFSDPTAGVTSALKAVSGATQGLGSIVGPLTELY